ncbi:thioredoxin family protein [Mucilaginibacter sp. BT774]|uniref:DUF1223 domain-containing protein n=1 Tax=Mucilaginibacter sp. BT774 TaxID=3062276 RepID=UPI002676A161|nr:DUF1223 domain-containing protein [Mucilaginibacter sp. BT774]MDO3627568.1 DUF1223 domain-containing protein [Mucilaginibacter sp. BT774]
MKISAISAFAAILLSSVIWVSQCSASNRKTFRLNEGPGFAVLELFTSEGCSSCPPADELIARIQKEAGSKPVYVLAFHVDYWNRLGWKDVFSQPEFSKRQYQYQRLFSSQVYTPQLIINGNSEFVGSDEHEIRDAVKQNLNGTPSTTLRIKAQQQNGGLKLDYEVKGKTSGNQLVIAIVQKHATSKVNAGENEGRVLSHVQIVRSLQTVELKQNGTQNIQLPAGFNPDGWEIIGLIQNAETGIISAATRATSTSTSL